MIQQYMLETLNVCFMVQKNQVNLKQKFVIPRMKLYIKEDMKNIAPKLEPIMENIQLIRKDRMKAI